MGADSAAGRQAGQPGRPRATASDADRDRFLGLLREHYARGHLDDAELDRRSGVVLSAAYVDEAAAVLSGLPLLTGQGAVGRGEAGRGAAGQTAAGQTAAGQTGSSRRSRRRHAQADLPGAGWVPTSERFRDPTSRLIMRVWIDPADDSRHYVPEPPAG